MSAAAKTRILIVDDYGPIRTALVELLQDEFHIVGERSSAVGLAEAIRECQPDVVLLDISMPEINGFTAARRLRKAGVDVKIIFVTDNSGPEYLEESLLVGGSGFVAKGRASTELRLAIRRAMEENLSSGSASAASAGK